MEKEWFYNLKGKRIGPISFQDIQDNIELGLIERDTLVWNNSMVDWSEASKTELIEFFSSIPPKLTAREINNRFAWALASTPLMFAIFSSGGINPGWDVILLILTIALNVFLWSKDRNNLLDAGYDSESWLWTGLFLIPVYLFIRARKTDKKYWIVALNILALLI